MPLLLVTYDSKKSRKDLSDLFDQLEKYSNVRLSKSSYIIITDKTPKIVCDQLKKYLGKKDNLYVISVKRPYEAFGPNLANDWLYKELTYE